MSDLGVSVSGSRIAGEHLTLNCDYDDMYDTIIQTAVTWMMNGSVVAIVANDDKTLTFSPLTTFDAGMYICEIQSNNAYIAIKNGKSAAYILHVKSM